MTAADPALEHNSTHARVHLDSPAGGWPERLHTTGRDPSYTFRAELGLPTDRPIVLSGHQPGLWHAGIAAKVFAADTLAATYHAHAAWLVIDLDNNDPFAMELPVRTGDHRLERVAWRCASGVPSASVPAHQPARRCVAPPPLSPERS